ncbi:hypothetical protein BLOT_013403, partial [Blomia tropicalis]
LLWSIDLLDYIKRLSRHIDQSPLRFNETCAQLRGSKRNIYLKARDTIRYRVGVDGQWRRNITSQEKNEHFNWTKLKRKNEKWVRVSPSRSNMTHMDSVHAASVSTLLVLTSLIYSFECD